MQHFYIVKNTGTFNLQFSFTGVFFCSCVRLQDIFFKITHNHPPPTAPVPPRFPTSHRLKTLANLEIAHPPPQICLLSIFLKCEARICVIKKNYLLSDKDSSEVERTQTHSRFNVSAYSWRQATQIAKHFVEVLLLIETD